MQVKIIYGARVVWEGLAFAVRDNAVEVGPLLVTPPVPQLAAVELEGQGMVGYVTHVIPHAAQRFIIAYTPDLNQARVLARSPYQPPQRFIQPEVMPPAVEVEDEGLTPLAVLEEHLGARVWALLADLPLDADSVCEMADEALLDIEGVGPASLRAIRAACHAAGV